MKFFYNYKWTSIHLWLFPFCRLCIMELDVILLFKLFESASDNDYFKSIWIFDLELFKCSSSRFLIKSYFVALQIYYLKPFSYLSFKVTNQKLCSRSFLFNSFKNSIKLLKWTYLALNTVASDRKHMSASRGWAV